MRSDRAEKEGRTVLDWLHRVQKKASDMQTPLVGRKTKDNREYLCQEARILGMRVINHDGSSEEKEQQVRVAEVEKKKQIKHIKQDVRQKEELTPPYQELVYKADYLYEKQAYVLALRLYEECWEQANGEVQKRILLVKLRRCAAQVKEVQECKKI